MKKFLLLFALILGGVMTFTSCENEDTQIENKWEVGIDETQYPDKLILRVMIQGYKVTYTAVFKNDSCTKCVAVTEYNGHEGEEDVTSFVEGFSYQEVKQVFRTILNQYT